MPDKNSFWDKKRPEEEHFASKEDVDKIDAKLDKLLKEEQQKQQQNTGSLATAKRMIGGVSKGFGDIAKSLGTSSSEKRMKIGQMPDRKPPIARTRPQNPIAGQNAGIKKHRISDAPLD
jgi:hypothetical protein